MKRTVRLRGQEPIAGEAMTCLEKELGVSLAGWGFDGNPHEAQTATIEVDAKSNDEADKKAVALVRGAGEACGLALNPEIVHPQAPRVPEA